MSDTTTTIGQGVTVDRAKDLLVDYSDVKSLLDLAVRQPDPHDYLASRVDKVSEVISAAREMAKTAHGLTLPKSLGFGSESFAEICAAIVNDRANNANLKSKAGKAGRDILRSRKS